MAYLKTCIFLVFLVATYQHGFSQVTTIKGQLLDKASNQPIPFVSVGIKNSSNGTLANQDGFFELELNTLPVTLVFSHVSYVNTEINVTKDTPLSVQLELATILLPEVTISLLGNKIMKEVYDKYSSHNSEYKASGYYKQVTTGDGEITEFFESFNDLLISSRKNVEKYKITNARYGQVKRDSSSLTFSIYNFKSLIFGIPTCKQKFKNKKNSFLMPLVPDAEKYYDFVVDEIIKTVDSEILKIKCLPLRQAGFRFEGYYYIDRNTKSILKIDGSIRGDLGLDLKTDKFQIENGDVDFLIGFKKSGSRSILEYIHASTLSKVTFSMMPIQKSKTFKTRGTLYITDQSEGTYARLRKKASLKTDDMEEVKRAPYNPEFWKKNNPMKYTLDEDKAIKIYDANNYFGTYFEK